MAPTLNWFAGMMKEWRRGCHVLHRRDGFIGTVQGYYLTREGRPGLNVQYDDRRFVHIYHVEWLERLDET